MGIYFRDILLIRISRGANNCGQHSLAKNIYFKMRFSPHSQLFYFNDRLGFCEFFEWKIKRINNADLFSQPPLLIFIKGANISGGHCTYYAILKNGIQIYSSNFEGLKPAPNNIMILHYLPKTHTLKEVVCTFSEVVNKTKITGIWFTRKYCFSTVYTFT